LFRIFLSQKISIAAAGGMATPSAALLCVCMLLGPLVETVVLVPMVSAPHVGPAPGLRAVWNDLTPLVASAMQRLRFFFVFMEYVQFAQLNTEETYVCHRQLM